LKIPATFAELLDRELVLNGDAVLCASVFAEWAVGRQDAFSFDRCVGYRQPLFLSGLVDDPVNMEEVDLEVYVTLTGQLFKRG